MRLACQEARVARGCARCDAGPRRAGACAGIGDDGVGLRVLRQTQFCTASLSLLSDSARDHAPHTILSPSRRTGPRPMGAIVAVTLCTCCQPCCSHAGHGYRTSCCATTTRAQPAPLLDSIGCYSSASRRPSRCCFCSFRSSLRAGRTVRTRDRRVEWHRPGHRAPVGAAGRASGHHQSQSRASTSSGGRHRSVARLLHHCRPGAGPASRCARVVFG